MVEKDTQQGYDLKRIPENGSNQLSSSSQRCSRLIDKYRDSAKLTFIILGSFVEIMRNLMEPSNPLYGRIDTGFNFSSNSIDVEGVEVVDDQDWAWPPVKQRAAV